MLNVTIGSEVKEICPDLKVIQIEAEVVNNPTSDMLWKEITDECEIIRANTELQEINKRPSISATRVAYKALGKDPNRYRPSAEALCRRIVKGMGIYRLLTLIDVINLISIQTGYSIGGFDADKIEGVSLILSRGSKDDIFNAIGRGELNIEGLPVYRDAKGPIGTPTSDEERTKLTDSTTHLLMLVNIYGESEPLEQTVERCKSLLVKYAGADSESIRVQTISAH